MLETVFKDSIYIVCYIMYICLERTQCVDNLITDVIFVGILKNKPVQLVADINLRVATALDDIRDMFTMVEKLGGPRKLTRIHVHTLAYQAIVTVKGQSELI